MKKYLKTSLLLTFVALAAYGCGQTSSTTNGKKSSSSTTNTSTTPTTPDTTTPTNPAGCDGVYRAGTTSCYYTNLPRLVFSGPGTIGPVYWSSVSDLPSFVSPNQFKTDAAFAVRMRPSSIVSESSRQGRTCSPFINSFTKLRVEVMLRRTFDSIGEVKILTGNINSVSNVGRFTLPGGTDQPYILEVIKVSSDNRCKIGSLTPEMVTGCNAGTYFADIPVNGAAPNPTTCVAFQLEMATDSTYDFPN